MIIVGDFSDARQDHPHRDFHLTATAGAVDTQSSAVEKPIAPP
jgi:hypothetical protein